ncbi:MAG: hypothetical protein U0234_24985 [Sandaracinus sp.]
MTGKIKGTTIREILRWSQRNGGQARLRAAVSKLPPELAALVDPQAEALGALSTTWYPAPLVHGLLEGVFGDLSDEARAHAMREAAHAAVRAVARGVYKLALEKIASPRLLASNIQRLWSLVCDDGKRTMTMPTSTSFLSRTERWSGHGPLLCELLAQNTAAILETMGMRDVVVQRDKCVSRGDACCETRFSWRE